MTIGLSATMEHQESQLNSSLKMVLNPQIILLVGSKKQTKLYLLLQVLSTLVTPATPKYKNIKANTYKLFCN